MTLDEFIKELKELRKSMPGDTECKVFDARYNEGDIITITIDTSIINGEKAIFIESDAC